MTPYLSLKGEKEKEQLRGMMARRFGADTREMAAELRTLANALDENMEFQRLMGGGPRTENAEDRILSRLADSRFRGEKVDGLLNDPPILPTPSQQRPASRDALRRTGRSINLSGIHNGQFDPRSYGRAAAECLPLGKHYSENVIHHEDVRPSSTQPIRSKTPQPMRPKTIQPIRSMTPQPAPSNSYFPYGSNNRHHSQPPYARAHTSIIGRSSQSRNRSRPPTSQRLYEVPDPPQTSDLHVPTELEPNPYYRGQATSPSERITQRDRRVPQLAEERRGRRKEPTVWPNHHETIYQNDSNIVDREYDPEKDADAESIGSIDYVQPVTSLRVFQPQNRVTWNGTFSG
ncbi:hypothetical protein SBOR_0101 [Sclerotinia borealis F-4128]|uniref:Uncharacterized protein n=1 Tax=Sclerotinia borealis (strain F-4128) TaxID=1432307 RepID=W9CUF9_SCLBF|nr:hypothetical protein SBOR_0101 [Sclerotinia borealis F-4128]